MLTIDEALALCPVSTAMKEWALQQCCFKGLWRECTDPDWMIELLVASKNYSTSRNRGDVFRTLLRSACHQAFAGMALTMGDFEELLDGLIVASRSDISPCNARTAEHHLRQALRNVPLFDRADLIREAFSAEEV